MLFITYFTFAHPCIIYYNSPHYSINTPNGVVALFFLTLSFILWGIILGFILLSILKKGIIAKINMIHIDQSGRKIQGVIKESKILKEHKSGIISREITFKTINFSGHNILHKMVINDSHPKEARFEIEKIIYIKVDPEFKKYPYLFLEGTQSRINYSLFLIWFGFLFGIVAYYYYAYATENGGLGWRFLNTSHPLLLIPGLFIFFVGLIYFIVKIFIMDNKTAKERLKLKFWGERAVANIINIKQTGTYINEQPQVKYTLEFKDRNGNLIQVHKKKIVSLMDIGQVSSEKYKEIFYLPENTEIFSFYDEIDD